MSEEFVPFEALELDGMQPSGLLQTLSYFGFELDIFCALYLQVSTFSKG
jgi:hypothetical protein